MEKMSYNLRNFKSVLKQVIREKDAKEKKKYDLNKYTMQDYKKWYKAILSDCLFLVDSIHSLPQKHIDKVCFWYDLKQGYRNFDDFARFERAHPSREWIAKRYLSVPLYDLAKLSCFKKHPINKHDFIDLHGIAMYKASLKVKNAFKETIKRFK